MHPISPNEVFHNCVLAYLCFFCRSYIVWGQWKSWSKSTCKNHWGLGPREKRLNTLLGLWDAFLEIFTPWGFSSRSALSKFLVTVGVSRKFEVEPSHNICWEVFGCYSNSGSHLLNATNFCPQIVCPCLNFGVLSSRFRRCVCFVCHASDWETGWRCKWMHATLS